MINVNRLTQFNNYSLGKPDIKQYWSSIQMNETTTSSGNLGKMIPVDIKELQPNQRVSISATGDIQFNQTLGVLLHKINGELISCFVPMRLIWKDWERFITGGESGLETVAMPTLPESAFKDYAKTKTINGFALYQRNQMTQHNINVVVNDVLKEIGKSGTNEEREFSNRIAMFVYGMISRYYDENPDSQGNKWQSDFYTLIKNTFPPLTTHSNVNPKENPDYKDSNGAYSLPLKERYYSKTEEDYIEDESVKTFKETVQDWLEKCIDILKDAEKTILPALEKRTTGDNLGNSLVGTLWDYFGLPLEVDFSDFEYYLEPIKKELRRVKNNKFANNFKNLTQELKINSYLLTTKSSNNLPTTSNKRISRLPFDAVNKYYNDWVRLFDWEPERDDEDLLDVPSYNWDWDYFTRARRYQLRGAMPTVPLDLSNTTGLVKFYKSNDTKPEEKEGNPQDYLSQNTLDMHQNLVAETIFENDTKSNFKFSDLMTAAALMNYYSANAKIKPRYSEQLYARWGVRIQDARLQLSEFLGAVPFNMTSQQIVNTGENQGNLTGQIWGAINNQVITCHAQEHGYMITFLVVKPQNSYELGYNPILKIKTKFEFATPEFVNLPDVPIYRNELDPRAEDDEIIGYKTIYDEYRTRVNKVTGLLRPSVKNGLSFLTMARNFKEYPKDWKMDKLVKCEPIEEKKRVFKTIEKWSMDFIFIIQISTKTAIPLPYQSNVDLAL